MKIGTVGRCWYCGTKTETTKDHFYPKSKGGTITVPACRFCQSSKMNLTPRQWIKEIYESKMIDPLIKERMINATKSLIGRCEDGDLKSHIY